MDILKNIFAYLLKHGGKEDKLKQLKFESAEFSIDF